ncbi:hypothetical protein ABBQ32_011405 [Trebouxia sp. C0010 RCD-2024]
MDTTKKIQVVDRDERLVVRTMSGGVAEPLDPAHYPALQNKGSPRVMSRLSGSFKETLLADEPADDAEARAHDLSPSIAAAGLGTSGNGTNSTSAVSVSPRIAARRALLGVPEDSPVPERTLKVATGQGDTKGVDCVAEESERWESVSPKRQVSLRRRTADMEAERAEQEATPTAFQFPVHDNRFAPLAEEETDDDLADVQAPLEAIGSRYA